MSSSSISTYVEVLMRVPPVFLLDEIFKTGLGLSNFIFPENENFKTYWFLLAISKCAIYMFACAFAITVCLLKVPQLTKVYLYLLSIFCTYFSYEFNKLMIQTIMIDDVILDDTRLQMEQNLYNVSIANISSISNSSYQYQNNRIANIITWYVQGSDKLNIHNMGIYIIFQNLVFQSTLCYIYYWTYKDARPRWWVNVLMISFATPSLLMFSDTSYFILKYAPLISTIIPSAMIAFTFFLNIPAIIACAIAGWRFCKHFVFGFGFAALLELEWNRLYIPCVLRTFWFLRILEHIVLYCFEYGSPFDGSKQNFQSSLVTDGNTTATESIEYIPGFSHMVKLLLITGCENSIAVLGMTSIISLICHYIGLVFRKILLIPEDDRKFGTISGILFCILSLQTGLTGLEPDLRYKRLSRNLYLLFTAMLHIVHGILNPLLLSLSASHTPTVHKHVRALAVSAFLIIYPTGLLIYLWHHHSVSTWLLAVTAFSIEEIIKVIVSLIIYSLFLMDSTRTIFWEELDDYVYYVRSIGNTIEFFFGIFLFFNGAWILFFESGGVIRALMMCVHAYFNIWLEARSGWTMFVKRKTAVNKISVLPDASPDQLAEYKDVCSICYQQMKTARITTCGHFFHAVCLRKWLYLQDYCPLCHTILYRKPVRPPVVRDCLHASSGHRQAILNAENVARAHRQLNHVNNAP